MEISFENRPDQYRLFSTIIASAQGKMPYKYIDSGGAIRGAKSFTNSLALLQLCRIFPGSKWGVFRKDLTILESTTIETIGKIISNSPNWKWNRSRAQYSLTNIDTGSRILFVGANESRDRDFTDTLGLEINGAFFDQLEDVSQDYYNAVLQRVGSWHIDNEPQPLVLSTFNPHPGWIKKEKYQRWKEGKLNSNEIYFPLSPVNEPSNTAAQWEVWNRMPPDVKARMIEGDWNSFENKNPWFYAFKKSEFTKTNPAFNRSYPLILSFDFNIDPATCVVAQLSPGTFFNVLKAYKINNCTITQLIDRIKADFPGAVYRVTGDPAGNARHQGFSGPNETMYSMIRKELSIGFAQIDKPAINYSGDDYWRETRIFCNSIFQNHPNISFDAENTSDLIKDIELATTDGDRDKLYKTSGNTEYGMHLVDCFVYLLLTYFNDYLKR